jgi:hypothetical protein
VFLRDVLKTNWHFLAWLNKHFVLKYPEGTEKKRDKV